MGSRPSVQGRLSAQPGCSHGHDGAAARVRPTTLEEMVAWHGHTMLSRGGAVRHSPATRARQDRRNGPVMALAVASCTPKEEGEWRSSTVWVNVEVLGLLTERKTAVVRAPRQ
jgi:hypothetical protein